VTDDVSWPWNIKVSWRYNLATTANYTDCLLWGSRVGYPSDSLASCYSSIQACLNIKHFNRSKVLDYIYLSGDVAWACISSWCASVRATSSVSLESIASLILLLLLLAKVVIVRAVSRDCYTVLARYTTSELGQRIGPVNAQVYGILSTGCRTCGDVYMLLCVIVPRSAFVPRHSVSASSVITVTSLPVWYVDLTARSDLRLCPSHGD